MIQITPALEDGVRRTFGPRGEQWLADLPELLDALASQWGLTPDGVPFPDARAKLVAPVRDSEGRPLVLKLAPGRESAAREARALAHWQGTGAVSLVAADASRGALLIERCVPGVLLGESALAEVAREDVLVETMRRLRSAGPIEDAVPSVADWLLRLERHAGRPRFPEFDSECGHALRRVHECLDGRDGWILLHGDLHSRNILESGKGSWVAIDPNPVSGPPAAECAAWLRNPRRRITDGAAGSAWQRERTLRLADRLALNALDVGTWAFVVTALTAVWVHDDGGAEDDVRLWVQCAATLRTVRDGLSG